jgi:hypothetical protein
VLAKKCIMRLQVNHRGIYRRFLKRNILLLAVLLFFASCTLNSFDRQVIDAFNNYDMGFLASHSTGEQKVRLRSIANMDEKEIILPVKPVVFCSKYEMHPQKWSLVLKDNKNRLVDIQYSYVNGEYEINSIDFSAIPVQ